MTIAVSVGPVEGSNSGASTATVAVNGCTAGNSLIVLVRWYDSVGSKTLTSVAATGESNATLLGSAFYVAGNLGLYQFAVFQNLSASGNKTVTSTISGDPAYAHIVTALEISGGNTSSLVDGSPATGTGVTNGSGAYSLNITTANAHEMVIAMGENQGAQYTATSGYTTFDLATISNFTRLQYKVDVTASGVQALDFTGTTSVSTTYSALAIALKVSAPAATTGRGRAL